MASIASITSLTMSDASSWVRFAAWFSTSIQPRRMTKDALSGRIWVEEQDYHIVRFNGGYGSSQISYYFNFDSWRTNAGKNQWLPSFIYSEEVDRPRWPSSLSGRRHACGAMPRPRSGRAGAKQGPGGGADACEG